MTDAIVLVRLWYDGNTHQNIPFKVQADLTDRRARLLKFAQDHVKNDPMDSDRQVVDFVFCDENCRMKIFSKSKRFFAFNSEYEFLTTVYRLDQEANYSEIFIKDADKGRPDLNIPYDLYY